MDHNGNFQAGLAGYLMNLGVRSKGKEMENSIREGGITEVFAAVESRSDEEEDSIDLAALCRNVFRHRLLIVCAGLAGFLIATAIAFILPPLYTSSASFIPPNSNPGSSMAAAVAGQLSSFGGAGDLIGGIKNSGDLYAGILKSRSIADALVKRFNLVQVYGVKKESDAEKVLRANTLIAVDPKSSIVTLSVVGRSPQFAHDLANAYMESLRETDGRLALSQSSQRRLFFGQQLAKEKDDLADAETELKKTEEESGLIAPSGQTETEIKTIADRQAQLAIREVQLAALRQSSTEQNPEMIRLRSEIDDLQGQLARLQRGSGTESTAAAIPTSKVPQLQLDYIRKEREVKYHEALFDMLSRQYESARLDEARDAPILQMLDPASYPDSKSSPKRALIMLGGLFFGIVAGCLWVIASGPLEAFRAALVADGK